MASKWEHTFIFFMHTNFTLLKIKTLLNSTTIMNVSIEELSQPLIYLQQVVGSSSLLSNWSCQVTNQFSSNALAPLAQGEFICRAKLSGPGLGTARPTRSSSPMKPFWLKIVPSKIIFKEAQREQFVTLKTSSKDSKNNTGDLRIIQKMP